MFVTLNNETPCEDRTRFVTPVLSPESVDKLRIRKAVAAIWMTFEMTQDTMDRLGKPVAPLDVSSSLQTVRLVTAR
jgi:hypothetical protein